MKINKSNIKQLSYFSVDSITINSHSKVFIGDSFTITFK